MNLFLKKKEKEKDFADLSIRNQKHLEQEMLPKIHFDETIKRKEEQQQILKKRTACISYHLY